MTTAIEVTAGQGFSVGQIEQYTKMLETSAQAKKLLSAVLTAQEMLRKMGEYNSIARTYAEAEAALYVKAVRENLTTEFTGKQRSVAEWVASMTESEQQALVEKAAMGVTITYLYDSMVVGRKWLELNERVEVNAQAIVDELEQTGSAELSLSRIAKSTYMTSSCQRKLIDAVKNRTKDRLLNRGAVCVGDGVYMLPDPTKKVEMANAIKKRLDSIRNDVMALYRFADECDRMDYLQRRADELGDPVSAFVLSIGGDAS